MTDPRTIAAVQADPALRQRIEAAIERLITVLDAADGDPDREDDDPPEQDDPPEDDDPAGGNVEDEPQAVSTEDGT